MKPLILEISAFGPYSDRQVVNFAKLKGRNFFLIHGATGAGKTTLLDAMCYALYGNATSDLRETKGLRSDHADPATPTEVVFTFSIGLKAYKVRRSPRQERRKKRGEGVTEQLPEAELWELHAGHPELIEAKYENVTRKIVDLLGFQCSQFRQVVLLPQGEFRKLLVAKSDERQQILKTLFKTEVYQQIEDHLRQKTRAQAAQIREMSDRRKWLLAECGAVSGEALSEACESLTKKQLEDQEQLEKVQEAYQSAKRVLTEGQLMMQKFAEARAAAEAFRQMQMQLPLFEEKRACCERLKKAVTLYEAEKTVRQWQTELNLSRAQYDEQEQQDAREQKKLQAAEKLLEAETAREAQRQAADAAVLKFREYAARGLALLEAEKTVQESAVHQKKQKEEKECIDLKLAALQADIEKKTLQLQKLLEGAAQEQAYLLQSQVQREFIKKQKQLLFLAAEEEKFKKIAEDTAFAYQKAEEKKVKRERAFKRAQSLFLLGQAAYLARSLKEHAPCPVCGSLDHPNPALSAGDMPSDEELKILEREMLQAQEQYEKMRGQILRAQADEETAQKMKRQLETELEGGSLESLPELEKKVEALEEKCRKARKDAREAEHLSQRLEALQAAAMRGQAKQQAAQASLQSAENALEAALAIVRERSEALPAAYRDVNVLQCETANACKVQQALKQSLENARQQAVKQAASAAASAAAFKQAAERLQRAQEGFSKEREVFYARLRKEGFADFADYAGAKRQMAGLAALEAECAEFDRGLAAASQRNDRAKAAVCGLVLPDIETLSNHVRELEQQQSGLIARIATQQAELKKNEMQRREILRLDEALREKEQKGGMLAGLYQVVRGDNPYEMNFQRFVLGALLDQVTAAASILLRQMSRSRYLLQRTTEVARKGSASGLDLYVFDNYTGIARPAATLSGGESFLASLALALGLADVVQQYAGGIRLDTILIDEGFGTLDPESLDMAIQTLMDLQAGGRLVGIISHVPELKERIDARLEVIGSKRGSRVQFHVG